MDDLKPRPYDLSSASERMRLWRECDGYLRTCERHHHGTDFQGREFARQALGQLVELGSAPDPLTERLAEALREAVTLVRLWHNMPIRDEALAASNWDLYQNSPEMKRINAVLRAYEESRK